MLRKVIAVLGVVTLLCTFFISTGTVSAATTPKLSSTSDFYNLEKTCAVIDAQLHGTQSPTFICAETKAQMGAAVSPNTVGVQCRTNTVTMQINYNNGANRVCFNGTGYVGVSISDVNTVTSPNHTNGWFLFYPAGYSDGWGCEVSNLFGRNWVVNFGNPGMYVTQIWPGSNKLKNCLPF